MNARLVIGLVAAALLAGAGYGLYALGMQRGHAMSAAAASPEAGRKVLYWHDPMVPGQKFDKPGKSPFMDMELVPVYADEAAGEAPGVRIDPQLRQSLGMRTVAVKRGHIASTFEAVGSIAWDEREVALVQARANGFVEKLHVRAPLERVRAGQPLAELYVPDWIAAQEELLAVARMGSAAPQGLLEASRQRMRLAGMSEAQVALVERDGRAHPRLAVVAPAAGVVTELPVREGMTVQVGAPLFRINGTARAWMQAEIPEAMAAQVRPGARVEVRTDAFPGEVFEGRVDTLLPEVNAATRTLKARIDIANPGGKLANGMFARASFGDAATGQDVLIVPSEAVIRTGKRDLVMVAGGEGRFRPVEVTVGREAGGSTEIRKGLAEGDQVVASGQFLVDSEASLKGTP